jgi:hypothetical protein
MNAFLAVAILHTIASFLISFLALAPFASAQTQMLRGRVGEAQRAAEFVVAYESSALIFEPQHRRKQIQPAARPEKAFEQALREIRENNKIPLQGPVQAVHRCARSGCGSSGCGTDLPPQDSNPG